MVTILKIILPILDISAIVRQKNISVVYFCFSKQNKRNYVDVWKQKIFFCTNQSKYLDFQEINTWPENYETCFGQTSKLHTNFK